MDICAYLNNYTLRRSLGLAPRTVEAEQRYIGYCSPLAGRELEQLTVNDVLSVFAPIVAQGHTRTAQALWVYLSGASKSNEHFAFVMQQIPRPRHQRKQIVYYELAQLNQLIAVSSRKYQLCWYLAAVYGLRRGELSGLRWSDIDFDRNIVHVCNQRQLIGGKLRDQPVKSAMSNRELPLIDQLTDLLAAMPHTSPYVLGVSPSTISHTLSRLIKRHSLPSVIVHGLRHTMATLAVEQDCNLRVLQTILGHSSINTTSAIYAHVSKTSQIHLLSSLSSGLLLPSVPLTFNQGVRGSNPR